MLAATFETEIESKFNYIDILRFKFFKMKTSKRKSVKLQRILKLEKKL